MLSARPRAARMLRIGPGPLRMTAAPIPPEEAAGCNAATGAGAAGISVATWAGWKAATWAG